MFNVAKTNIFHLAFVAVSLASTRPFRSSIHSIIFYLILNKVADVCTYISLWTKTRIYDRDFQSMIFENVTNLICGEFTIIPMEFTTINNSSLVFIFYHIIIPMTLISRNEQFHFIHFNLISKNAIHNSTPDN